MVDPGCGFKETENAEDCGKEPTQKLAIGMWRSRESARPARPTLEDVTWRRTTARRALVRKVTGGVLFHNAPEHTTVRFDACLARCSPGCRRFCSGGCVFSTASPRACVPMDTPSSDGWRTPRYRDRGI